MVRLSFRLLVWLSHVFAAFEACLGGGGGCRVNSHSVLLSCCPLVESKGNISHHISWLNVGYKGSKWKRSKAWTDFFPVVPAATLLNVFLISDNICHNMPVAVTCSVQFLSTVSLGEILTDLLRHRRVWAAHSSPRRQEILQDVTAFYLVNDQDFRSLKTLKFAVTSEKNLSFMELSRQSYQLQISTAALLQYLIFASVRWRTWFVR